MKIIERDTKNSIILENDEGQLLRYFNVDDKRYFLIANNIHDKTEIKKILSKLPYTKIVNMETK